MICLARFNEFTRVCRCLFFVGWIFFFISAFYIWIIGDCHYYFFLICFL
jgi:hypothetical protein